MFKHLAVALMDYLLVISEFRIFHGLIDLRCFMVFSDANLKGQSVFVFNYRTILDLGMIFQSRGGMKYNPVITSGFLFCSFFFFFKLLGM